MGKCAKLIFMLIRVCVSVGVGKWKSTKLWVKRLAKLK